MSSAHGVAVVGDIIRDVVASPEGPIHHDTDTPARIDIHFGGSAANTATWLGYLGTPVSFVGRVGSADVAILEAHFRNFGVKAVLQPDDTHPTGTIVVIVEGESRSMLTDRGANALLDAAAIPADVMANVSHLHLTGYSFFHTARPEAFFHIIDRARSAGTVVSLDCSSVGFLSAFGVGKWWEVLSHVDIVRGNADEACLITGANDVIDATRIIGSRGHTAVITQAAEGALWCEPGGEVFSAPATPLGESGYVDPTGAGDSFSAGFLAALSTGSSVEAAVRSGLNLSAQVVGQWGAGPS